MATTRMMEIVTPLGADVLLFHRMHGREEISRLFEYEIDLLSAKGDIDLDKILAKNVTVKLELPERGVRHFNGFITRFAQVGTLGRYHLYRATVRPWLWFLTRTADCRIFQEMNVPDIVKKVFDDHSVADVKVDLTGSYAKRDYCVQYRETDFNFVSRLLEDEGIYYYFKHVEGRHTLILADSYSAHAPYPGQPEIPFVPLTRNARPNQEYIHEWILTREVQPGKYVLNDYDMEKPNVGLRVTTADARKHELSDYEIFDYPGAYTKTADGEHYVRTRLEELQYQFELATGKSNARGLSVGYLFKLTGQPRVDQNREYLVLGAEYEMEFNQYEAMDQRGASYTCQFSVLNSRVPLRPQRGTRRPFVQGPQTAVVVGPAGDEIYTDKYGRVKVQFHWDRRGKKDENSSCWVRVSHPWAGKQWGMVAIPRMGQEVVVDFLEGDPDRPLITGRVYNGDQMPPYELPANMTQTGVKTRSSKGGGGANFNEIRFEDKKGSEQLFIHAEKNQDIEVENDETTLVKHDRTETVGNNETITIGVNRTETVGANESITIGANRTISVGASETATVALQRTHAVGVNETIAIGAAQEVAIGAAQTVAVGASQTINVGASQSTSVGANRSINVGSNLSTTVGADESRNVANGRSASVGKDDSLQVGKNLVVNAGDSVTIKTGSASITMKKDGTISIKGKDITVDGSGKVNVKAASDIVMKGSKILQN